jgi:hypothetical protein
MHTRAQEFELLHHFARLFLVSPESGVRLPVLEDLQSLAPRVEVKETSAGR